MDARALPSLNALCEKHEHVALFWDERLDGRALLGVGAERSLMVETPVQGDWSLWEAFLNDGERRGKWSFGWIGYDLHQTLDLARIEQVPQGVRTHPGEWPLLMWWQPEVVLEWKPGSLTPELVAGHETSWASDVLEAVQVEHREPASPSSPSKSEPWEALTACWTPDMYRAKFDAVHRALRRGDIYEMNLCMPWQGAAPGNASWTLFERLASKTKAPHSAYMQAGVWRALCGSPERFLAKQGRQLQSQPIKGTVRRGATPAEDALLKASLAASEKERAENVMIVDLVRNDLSRVAERNSVTVEELFGVHSFATVHQMISTVSCTLTEDATSLDIMRATFPMGSMTGAPKLSAMSHIARLEETGRGLYSGTLGFVDPLGDWDFNVVIRSLLHRADTGRVDATVGGAITLLSEVDAEHEECLLKAEALRQCLVP